MNKLSVVVGGQFGSEGKGAVAAHLHRTRTYAWAVRVAGPNAGHTVVGKDGVRWPLRQVPVGAVADPGCALYIAPGSEIDMDVLASEVQALDDAGYGVSGRLFISPQATLLEPKHIGMEAGDPDGANSPVGIGHAGLTGKHGSTQKGIGAARAERLLRHARLFSDATVPDALQRVTCMDLPPNLGSRDVLIEGTQGFGLGLHAGWYPHCTSSDARAVDFCAMAGLSPWEWDLEVWVCLRPYPIRIAGNSGPLHEETTWEALGLPVEYTTVTHKPRRVGQWDAGLAWRAVQANGRSRVKVAFTMADQVVPGLAGWTEAANPMPDETFRKFYRWVRQIESDTGARVQLVGTGPDTAFEL